MYPHLHRSSPPAPRYLGKRLNCIDVAASPDTTGDEQCFARHPFRIVAGKVNDSGSDVVGIPYPAELGIGNIRLGVIAFGVAGGGVAFGDDHSRIDRIDSDLPLAE